MREDLAQKTGQGFAQKTRQDLAKKTKEYLAQKTKQGLAAGRQPCSAWLVVLHLAACLETVIFSPSVLTGRGKLWPRDVFCFQVEILAL